MDQQNPAAAPISSAAATSSAVSAIPAAPQLQPPPQSQPPPPQSQPQPQPLSSAPATPPIPTPLPPSSNPNPVPNENPNPRAPTPLPLQHSQSLPQPSRPLATLPRPWQPPHLTPSSSSAGISPSSSSLSSPALPQTSAPPSPRGGVALGIPAHRSSLSPSQPPPFSPSYGHFGGLVRSGVNLSEPSQNSSSSQVRPSMQGVQGMGMLGSLSSSSQMRPGGIPPHHQQRPVQSSLRPVSSPSNQLPSSQNHQGHGLLRVPSAGSPGSPSPSTSQSVQSLNQPWLASGAQGKPPLPSPSYRQPLNPQSLQQRSHIQPQPQTQLQQQQQLQPPLQQQQQQQQQQLQSHPLPMSSQQRISALQQQQPLQSQQTHEHYGKQVPPSRVPQGSSHQQQITRVLASSNQKLSTPASVQPNTVQGVAQNRITTAETDETCNRILSKRSIHELVSQVDPSEKLDPEVEDILMDIADDFVESITTFGCSLAKHRKSSTLEAKDILLHLERNWNITLPGFGGDEIKSFRKPVVNDIHMERLVAIKKSMLATETAKTRNPSGQATGNTKGSLAKTPANIIGSPNVKI